MVYVVYNKDYISLIKGLVKFLVPINIPNFVSSPHKKF